MKVVTSSDSTSIIACYQLSLVSHTSCCKLSFFLRNRRTTPVIYSRHQLNSKESLMHSMNWRHLWYGSIKAFALREKWKCSSCPLKKSWILLKETLESVLSRFSHKESERSLISLDHFPDTRSVKYPQELSQDDAQKVSDKSWNHLRRNHIQTSRLM
jgi:hypothetical protein